MSAQRAWPASRVATVAGLVVGAIGISILWATGQDFPIYPPPGIVILLVGAFFVGLTSWRWTPAVGAFMGLFVTVGFLIEAVVSGTGLDNLTGDAGTGRAIGQGIQMVGVVTALVAGVIATQANYRNPSQARQ